MLLEIPYQLEIRPNYNV